jgi:hypothetical protein
MVDGYIPVAALLGLAWYLGKEIPHAETFAVRIPSAFYLICCGSRPPKKVFRKWL